MIFRNMEALGIDDVHKVLKVGDTASDIKEGKHAGVWSAGVVIGSSEMGLSEEWIRQTSPGLFCKSMDCIVWLKCG